MLFSSKQPSSNGIEKRPKLRFPKYNDSWHGIRFGDLIEEFSRRTKDEDEDILLSAAIEGMFLNTELFGHQRGASNKGYKKIGYGTLVLSTQNLHLGNANVNLRFEHGMVSPAYKTYRIKNCSVKLLAEWIKSEKAKQFFYDATTVGASVCRRNVEWETLYNQFLYLPSDNEQKHIADFLSLISEKIHKQELLIEDLKKYKRGVVKTLLDPKQNKHQDVIWESDTIGNLGTFIKGATLSKADISDSGTPFILYGELYTTYKEVVRTIVRTTRANVDDVYLSKVGDVVIPTSGETPEEISTASCIMVPDVILAGDLNIYRSTIVDGRIMSYLLNHIVNDQIARVAQGKSVVHVQASEIGKISITYPDHNEQERIARVLEFIDNRIEISEDTLNSMHKMKKALLQQLFI